MKSKRTKACEISKEVREAVEKRDSIDGYPACIFCGRPGRGEAHCIGRAQAGLGIEENILTVCRECHREMDNGLSTGVFREIAKQYLKSKYPYWDESKLVYSKWT